MPKIIFLDMWKRSMGKKDIITVIWSLEKTQKNFMKVSADINYINTCKKERLATTFAKANLLLKSASSNHK